MSVDRWLAKRYDADKYNCAHFAAEVWAAETGENIEGTLTGFLRPESERRASMDLKRQFVLLDRPASPCLVLMRRPRCQPHVGVYLRGQILHITKRGVTFQPIDVATLGFPLVGFYGHCHSFDKSA